MLAFIEAFNRIYVMAFGALRHLDGLAPLAIRLYLTPVMLSSGYTKLTGDNFFMHIQEDFPFPFNVLPSALSWFLATWTEFLGGILLFFGVAVRVIAIPLLVTMWVAAVSVHWDNGWAAIAPSNPSPVCIEGTDERAQANAFVKFVKCYNVNERTIDASERLAKGKEIMQANGRWSWLNAHGSFVKLNSGIEFATTYFVMLLVLLFMGGGRYVSVDWWLGHWVDRRL
ncbi:MAG: DoxX family protein [Pseudomonadota bacterium]